ncbi:MAG: hypothetical protein KatS3mg115_0574 [Candidatus Poribacteria bacterium]|nr:MAG: hypothetical protein KatS3mg115_0574 [Candidatus Poribacteria bacterium]
MPVADHIRKEIVQLILRTHPETKEAPEIVRRYVRYGASPRGAQALELAAKVHALLSDRYHVAAEDVRAVVLPSLRHRIVRNFEAIAEGIESDAILAEAIAEVSGSSNA